MFRRFSPALVVPVALISVAIASAASGALPIAEQLSAVRSQADLDAITAATSDAALAKALQENSPAIFSAAADR
jgi:hypothetical protein